MEWLKALSTIGTLPRGASQRYPKITTVWLRDSATKHRTLIEGQYAKSEFQYLAHNEWGFTEKVDGTNIRVGYNVWSSSILQGEPAVQFAGRTNRATIPPFLLDRLRDLFPPEKFAGLFPEGDAILFGEGYGARIQRGGGNYRADGVDFVAFDAKVRGYWLGRDALQDICHHLGIKCVPWLGVGTLPDMIDRVRSGFASAWGDFPAEGIVARPLTVLLDHTGNPIMTKLKAKDFPNPEQTRNYGD